MVRTWPELDWRWSSAIERSRIANVGASSPRAALIAAAKVIAVPLSVPRIRLPLQSPRMGDPLPGVEHAACLPGAVLAATGKKEPGLLARTSPHQPRPLRLETDEPPGFGTAPGGRALRRGAGLSS